MTPWAASISDLPLLQPASSADYRYRVTLTYAPYTGKHYAQAWLDGKPTDRQEVTDPDHFATIKNAMIEQRNACKDQ